MKSQLTTVLAGRASLLAALLASVLVAPAFAADREPVPIPEKPADMTYESLRAVQYCEVWLFTGTPETGIAGVYYNTSALNNSVDKTDTCPADMWDKVTVAGLEAQYDVIGAYKNGPRGWTMDSITLPVGPVIAFDGIETRWMGEGNGAGDGEFVMTLPFELGSGHNGRMTAASQGTRA